MLSRMSHLQTILQDGNKLLDLTVIQHARGNSSFGRKSLQKVNPLGPLAVLRALDGPHVLRQRDGELVLGYEVVGALRETVVDLCQDRVLFLDQEVGGQVRELALLHGDVFGRWALEELVGAVELVAVGGAALGAAASVIAIATVMVVVVMVMAVVVMMVLVASRLAGWCC